MRLSNEVGNKAVSRASLASHIVFSLFSMIKCPCSGPARISGDLQLGLKDFLR